MEGGGGGGGLGRLLTWRGMGWGGEFMRLMIYTFTEGSSSRG
jgi:hypothetical protein